MFLRMPLLRSFLIWQLEMRWLTLRVVGTSQRDASEDVERELAIGRRVVDWLTLAIKVSMMAATGVDG